MIFNAPNSAAPGRGFRLVVGVVILLLGTAGSVRAAPLSRGGVLVADDGTVLLAGARVGTLALPPPPRHLDVSRHTLGRHHLLHVRVVGRGDRSFDLLLELRPGSPKVVFSGSTGPRGVDGEWRRVVKVGEGQVLRYQRRQGITRCDGEAVYLFPEIYDFRTGRFRPVSRRPHGKGLAVIVARRLKSAHPATLSPKGPASSAPTTRAPAWHLNSFRPAAASTQAGDGGQASSLTAPMEIADGDPHTVWAEGRSSDGRGEWVTLRRPPSPYKLQRLRIIPGDASSPAAFAQGNRLASVLVVLSPTQRFRVRFPRDPLVDGGTFTDPYDIPLPTPSTTRCVTIVIERVYRGRGAPRGGGRTAIAEVKAITELDNAQGLRRLLKDLTGGDPHRAHVAATILARQKASILPTLKRAIASTRGAALQRLVGVLETIATPKAAHIALAAWPRLSPQGRRTTHDLLRHLGARALPVLRTLVKRDDPRGIVAAKLLGNLRSPEAQAALLAVAGQGPDIKRAAVATSLIRLGEKRALAKTLEALMKTAPKYLPRRADLVLAAARLARDAPNSVRAKTAVRLSLLWPKIGKDRSFELRYRLLQAVGSLDARGQKAWIIAHSRGHDPILRWQALIHLAQVTDTTTTGRLLEALKDRDPRIRASAARSLGQRKAPPIIKALATILRYEAWPFVARAAATALGRHCSPATEKALRRAIRYRALGIDVSALSALARCRPHNLFDTLVTLTMNRHQPVTLRSRAAALIDRKLAAGHTAIIASLFLRLRKNALGSARAERVAATLAETLGRIGGGDAAGRPLRDALALDASVPIRAAAARALGTLCWRPAAPALRRALHAGPPAVRRAARDAMARCRAREKP